MSSKQPSETSAFSWAFFLNLSFTIIEIVGGILTNSVAVISDAIHDLGDSIALGLAWYLERVAHKQGDNRFTFGYKRFSVLGAFINSAILIVGSLYIFSRAFLWFADPQEPDSVGMVWLAFLGIGVNFLAFFKLRSETNLNQKTASLHLLEDVFGWVAVLIGAVIIYFTDWFWIDPLLSAGIAIWIFLNARKNFLDSLRIFLQKNPLQHQRVELEEALLKLPQVASFHDLHLWSLDGNYHVISMHIVLEAGLGSDLIKIKNAIRDLCRSKGIAHVTIEVEEEGEGHNPQIEVK